MSNEKITLEEKFIFHDYESFINKMFEEDLELGREMLEESIHEYKENGDEEYINLILLNLRRIIKSQENLKVFEALNLNESQINNAISEINYDRNIINKMLEVLDIKERI
jgi:hypothetical protein